jgi:hypothetical protein
MMSPVRGLETKNMSYQFSYMPGDVLILIHPASAPNPAEERPRKCINVKFTSEEDGDSQSAAISVDRDAYYQGIARIVEQLDYVQ